MSSYMFRLIFVIVRYDNRTDILCKPLYLFLKVLYNCLMKVLTEAETCNQAIINIPFFRLKILTLTVEEGATEYSFNTVLNQVLRFITSFLHHMLSRYTIYS